MEQEPDWAADDPEIAALLTFTPVPRRIARPDSWDPASQRGFIAWLAAEGNAITAASAVGRSLSGARQVRREDERGEFAAAWTRAIELHRRRSGAAGKGPPPAPPPHPRDVRGASARREEPDLDEAEKTEIIAEIMKRYGVKLRAERQARLEGRITEADFYVRQLTFIEIILDIGGRTQDLLDAFRGIGVPLPEAAATPGSTLLERTRRAWWLEKGEADRPPPAPLGRHNELFATGRDDYDPERDGDRKEWERRQKEKQGLAAEAQREWEERARQENPWEASLPAPRLASDNDDAPEPAA